MVDHNFGPSPWVSPSPPPIPIPRPTPSSQVVGHDVLGRLMVQCLRQQGLAVVLSKLLGFDGCEFYTQEWPTLVGRAYGEVMFSFRAACPVGIKRAEGNKIILNPPFDAVLAPGDKVHCMLCGVGGPAWITHIGHTWPPHPPIFSLGATRCVAVPDSGGSVRP